MTIRLKIKFRNRPVFWFFWWMGGWLETEAGSKNCLAQSKKSATFAIKYLLTICFQWNEITIDILFFNFQISCLPKKVKYNPSYELDFVEGFVIGETDVKIRFKSDWQVEQWGNKCHQFLRYFILRKHFTSTLWNFTVISSQ